MTIVIGVGKWGGIWCARHHLCLGFVAFHWYAGEDGEIMQLALEIFARQE